MGGPGWSLGWSSQSNDDPRDLCFSHAICAASEVSVSHDAVKNFPLPDLSNTPHLEKYLSYHHQACLDPRYDLSLLWKRVGAQHVASQ